MLSGQTLEMLTDMRMQFASMLADIGFVRAPQRGARGSAAWVDDRKAAWNQHSAKPAVVSSPTCIIVLEQALLSVCILLSGLIVLSIRMPTPRQLLRDPWLAGKGCSMCSAVPQCSSQG